MVTGGEAQETTEIFQDTQWKVLPNGNLPIQIWGLNLITIHNEVFSFGKIMTFFILIHQNHSFILTQFLF